MKKPGIQKELIDRGEWDFSTVAEVELEACLRYELAREVADPAKYFQLNTDLDDLTEEKAGALLSGLNLLLPPGILKHFPGTPWLQIPSALRVKSATGFASYYRAVRTPQDESFDRATLYRLNKSGSQTIPLWIDWKQSNTSILDDLRNWLTEQRPPTIHAVIDRGRLSVKDDLRQLSAMRLRHVYSVEDAVRVTGEAFGKSLYLHRSAWEKACGRVIDLFEATFPNAGLPRSAVKASNRKLK